MSDIYTGHMGKFENTVREEKFTKIKLGRWEVGIGDRISGTYYDPRYFNRQTGNSSKKNDGCECDFHGIVREIVSYRGESPIIEFRGGITLFTSEMTKIKITDHKKYIPNTMVKTDEHPERVYAWGYLKLKRGKDWRLVKVSMKQDPKDKVTVEVHDGVGKRTLKVDSHLLTPYWTKPKKPEK